jgi:hypothetical protein
MKRRLLDRRRPSNVSHSILGGLFRQEQAQQLLNASVLVGQKRYAVQEGRPYCAQDDGIGGWHGYPVGWKEVPATLRITWEKREHRVRKRDIDRYWEG